MAERAMTETTYLSVLTMIRNKSCPKHEGMSDDEYNEALKEAMPNELLSVIARVLSNLERLTVAQEVLAGIRNKDLIS